MKFMLLAAANAHAPTDTGHATGCLTRNQQEYFYLIYRSFLKEIWAGTPAENKPFWLQKGRIFPDRATAENYPIAVNCLAVIILSGNISMGYSRNVKVAPLADL